MEVERRRSRTIGSVDSALRLLETFRDHPTLSVKEGAEILAVAPSTVHRLLATLLSHGFVSQDAATRRYRAGPALLDIALGALEGIDVRRAAHPHLEQLTQQVRETVNLIVLDGRQIRFIDSIEGPEAVRVSSRTGTVLPAHCTAGGKVLLAQLDRAQLRAALPERRLGGLTSHSITDRAALETELEAVRARGYATSFEQSTVGLSAVAVPILDARGHVVAAIGVSAPAARLDNERVEQIVAAATQAAAAISRELRGSGR
jgi:DNA-binding IclR family transcriptional regulator